ncbi:uncharacterized protein LOC109545555 [Dendroctonus ponderosae]|uniref:DUF4200 domain-containing protein n=2 Tax=Dendroctonus ponderosae TaxID=77166 RepID=A0AAR5QF80_DENPD|nr:uncharacterized protein LOC109545555 [Dendroctonus ponderosae]
MPEYSFDLERSQYFKNRSSLLKSKESPKLSDAKKNLGDTLSQVVFEQCEDALKEGFGLKNPLQGPGDILWISPSDLLIGKIALKPPFTPKCLQALTHKGILEIGQELERKFRQEMELDKQKALEKYKSELLTVVEDRMKSEVKDVEIRERLACQMEKERQSQEFEILLKDELDKLEANIREQYEQIIANHESYLKSKWEDALEMEVQKTVQSMTKMYLAQLDDQERRLTEIFKLELKKKELLREFDAQLSTHKTNESLRQLKHNLECTNLVNMMYVICTERQKCCDQKEELEKHYKAEISKLEETIRQREQLLETVATEKDRQLVEVSIRETCLKEVIKQFQKFINFALRSAPAQAEFLLSVEKMMVFELTNKVTQSKIKSPKEAPGIIPWMEVGKPKSISRVLSTLEIHDNHECFRELNPPVKSELDENDTLPAIYFKNKTYVREDFRDMLAGGVSLSPSNELWNRDVEILVENWRHQAEGAPEMLEETPKSDSVEYLTPTESFDKESIMVKVVEMKDKSSERLDENMILQSERRRSNKSTVQFVAEGAVTKSTRTSMESRKLSIKSSLKPHQFSCVNDIDIQPLMSASNLLAARDSLDLLLEKRQKSTSAANFQEKPQPKPARMQDKPHSPLSLTPKPPSGKNLAVTTKDSIIMRLPEIAKMQSSSNFEASPRDSLEIARHALEDRPYEVNPTPSKLVTARNSVEILKESLQKLKIPSLICQRKEVKKSDKLPTSTGFFGTCCTRCKRMEGMLEISENEPTRTRRSSKVDSLHDDERSVKISRIQIINLDDHAPTPSTVSFNNEPMFFKERFSGDRIKTVDAKSTMTPLSQRSRRKMVRRVSKRPTNRCKIVGEMQSKAGDQTTEEFTAQRIHSLIRLIGDQPQLLQLFTSGVR